MGECALREESLIGERDTALARLAELEAGIQAELCPDCSGTEEVNGAVCCRCVEDGLNNPEGLAGRLHALLTREDKP